MRTVTRNLLPFFVVVFFGLLFLIFTPQKVSACTYDSDCPSTLTGSNYCCGGTLCNDVYTYFCDWGGGFFTEGVCSPNTSTSTTYNHTSCSCGCYTSGGIGYCSSCATPPPQVCTPGSYQTSCSGNCGGCPADSGEQLVYQCRGDGSGYDFQYSQCSTGCSGPCAPPPASCPNGACDNGETCSTCSQDCGTCPTPPPGGAYCGDSSCNNGETCSTCSSDCGACTGVSCNTDVSLAVSPNPANVNSTVNFSVVSGDASTFLGDSWTGGVTGCGGAWNSINCTSNASGTFQWSHTWKHCEGSLSNCSSTCSKSINFTINAIIPPAPTVSTPACIDSGYSGSGVTISWTNLSPPVTYVDLGTDINFGSYANKAVSGTSTTAPAGFSNSLTLNPGTTYYVRTWNGSQHSSTANFSIPVCPASAPTFSTVPCANATTYSGNEVNISWTNPDVPVSWVDISNSSTFPNPWWHKGVTGSANTSASTNAPSGFTQYGNDSLTFTATSGTTYYARLWNGSMSPSSNFNVPACPPPSAPVLLPASCPAPGTQATLSWNPATWATSYNLRIGTSGPPDNCGGSNKCINSILSTTYDYSPTSPGPTYYWKVQSVSPLGSSTWSNVQSFTCPTVNIAPWIQVTGDVHSNEEINAPGGP